MAGTQRKADRSRPPVTHTMSPEAIARLDEIARRRRSNRSATLEAMVFATEMPPPLPGKAASRGR